MKQDFNQQYLFFSSINRLLNNRFLRLFLKRIEGRVDHRIKNRIPKPPNLTIDAVHKIALLYISIHKLKHEHLKRMLEEEGVRIEKEEEFNRSLDELYQHMEKLEIKTNNEK